MVPDRMEVSRDDNKLPRKRKMAAAPTIQPSLRKSSRLGPSTAPASSLHHVRIPMTSQQESQGVLDEHGDDMDEDHDSSVVDQLSKKRRTDHHDPDISHDDDEGSATQALRPNESWSNTNTRRNQHCYFLEIGQLTIDETKLVNQIDHDLNTPSGMSQIGTPDEPSEDETDVFKETAYRVQVALEGFC